jgi:hypothetical protein
MAMATRVKTIGLLGIGVLCVSAFAASPARPGMVNYIEGGVFLDGKQVNEKDVGNVKVNIGQVLSTTSGKAEILLTPGVFFRLDSNSAVRMISPSITPTQVELVRGRAAVEVDELYPQNNLEILDGGVNTQLVKIGYYEFYADNPTVEVFTGKAAVQVGDEKYKVVKGHHEIELANAAEGKPDSFNIRDASGNLYNWSSLRSQYLAEANNEIAGNYAGSAGFNPGWYWDPDMWAYTFIGMDPYWSPFGFGFYPPSWGGFYGGGFYGRGYYGSGFGGGGGFHGGGGGGFHGGGEGGGGGRR